EVLDAAAGVVDHLLAQAVVQFGRTARITGAEGVIEDGEAGARSLDPGHARAGLAAGAGGGNLLVKLSGYVGDAFELSGGERSLVGGAAEMDRAGVAVERGSGERDRDGEREPHG